MAINLSSAFHATKLVLPTMRRKGWGRVINVASAHALVASPYKAAYVAAKHGVLGLTKVTALETAEDGITCNAICPGYVRTPLVERQIDDQARAHGIDREKVISDVLLKNQPNKRFVEVAELAALALFLCSDNGGSVTGAALPMDGAGPLTEEAAMEIKRINLALQGGGAHGAYTWGVLDRLLDEDRLEVEAISGTSAGAMNAAVFADGMGRGGREEARRALDGFWTNISRASRPVPCNPRRSIATPPDGTSTIPLPFWPSTC